VARVDFVVLVAILPLMSEKKTRVKGKTLGYECPATDCSAKFTPAELIRRKVPDHKKDKGTDGPLCWGSGATGLAVQPVAPIAR
jgi:hypothetical protein